MKPLDFNQSVAADLATPVEEPLDDIVARLGLKKPEEDQAKIKFDEADIQEMQSLGIKQGKPGLQPVDEAAQKQAQGAQELAKGVGKGLGKAVQNIYNGAIDLVNGVSQYATFSKGGETGDLIPGSAKLNVPQFEVSKNARFEERLGAMVGQYGAPVVATMGMGGGALAATAVGAGVDFMTLDPHQERLSKLVIEEYPEARNAVVFGNMFQWLAENNPDKESEIEGRFKNMLEGIGIGGAVAGAIKGISKMTGATRSYVAAKKAGTAATQAPPPSFLREAEVAAIEARINAEAPTLGDKVVRVRALSADERKVVDALEKVGDAKAKQQLSEIAKARVEVVPPSPLLDPNPVVKGVDGGTPRINPHSEMFDNLLLFVDNAQSGYVSRTFEDLKYQARLMGMAEDQEEIFANILNRKAGDKPFSQEETAFIAQELVPRLDRAAREAMMTWANTPRGSLDEGVNLLAWQNAKQRAEAISNIAKGSASEAGALLNAQKLLKEMGQAVDPSKPGGAIEQLVSYRSRIAREQRLLDDAAFRDKLSEELIQKFGGKMNVDKLKEYILQVDELVKTLPPGEAERAYRMLEQAATTGATTKTLTEVSSFARLQMLASPKSAMGAVIGNAITTLNSVATGFTKGAIMKAADIGVPGAARFASIGGADEALAEAVDFYNGAIAGFGPAFERLKKGPLSPERDFIKAELKGKFLSPYRLGVNPLSYLGRALDAAGTFGETILSPGTALLASADDFFGTVNRYGKLYPIAMKEARAQVAAGAFAAGSDEFLEFVNKRIRDATVAEFDMANAFAQKQVFANPVNPASGDVLPDYAAKYVNMMNSHPVGQLLQPFLTTKFNMIDYALEHSILGPIVRNNTIGKAILAGGPQGAEAAAKVLNGSLLTGLTGYFAYQGFITGAEPYNPRLTAALKESNKGWQPYSIKVGDTYVSYKQLEPMASILKLGSGLSNLVGHVDERDMGASTFLAASVLADTYSPQAMIEGMSTIYDIMTQLQRFNDDPKAFEKFIQQQSSKLSNALMRDVERGIDPYKRDTKADDALTAIQNAYSSKVPFFSTDTPVVRNMWGEPVVDLPHPGALEPALSVSGIASRAYNMFLPIPISSGDKGSKVREVIEAFARHEIGKPDPEQLVKLSFAMPERSITVNGIQLELTPEEYERYVMYSAGYLPDSSKVPGKEQPFTEPLKKRVEREALQVYDMVKGRQVQPIVYNTFMKELQKIVQGYRKTARKMMEQDPVLIKRLQKAEAARRELQDVGL